MSEKIDRADHIIYEKCQLNKKQFIEDWETLVNIDSPSRYGEGLSKVGNIVAKKLKSFGCKVETHSVKEKDEGFNVVGELTGNGKGSILLLAHMDTVLPVGSATQRPFRIDSDEKAYGPGVSDNKSGVIQCLHALKLLQEIGFEDFKKITLLANCQEENGSHSTRELIKKLAEEHDYVLCAEPGSPGDGICVNRAGYGSLITEVKGVSSHTAYPWMGSNAADEVAHQVLQLITLADKENGTVLSTKILESGIANADKCVAPDYARAITDFHAYTISEMDRVEKSAIKFSKEKIIPGTEVKCSVILHYPPFVKSEKAQKMADLAQKIYAELGLSLKVGPGAAATDAGWASVVNNAVLCSFGPVSGGQNHSDKEWADAKTAIPRLYMMIRMLIELGSKGLL
jgi:glutamate carboxypeptidase